MNRPTLAFLVCLASTLGCGPNEGASGAAGGELGGLPDLGGGAPTATTEYNTSMQFLPIESGGSQGLSLQLANLASSAALSRRYAGWLLSGSRWRSVLDLADEDQPVREPWRLLPADSLRLTVTADGDPNALLLRSGTTRYSLEFGNLLDAWEDRGGTWHEIRDATWTQQGRRVKGILVLHRFAVTAPERPALFGPYERAILRSSDGAILVLFSTRDPELYGDPFAWMYADGLTRRWTVVETRTVEVANLSQLRRNVPIRTWFRIPEPDIRGEFSAIERQYNELTVASGPKPYNALQRVRGWIEFAGERRTVEGLLEQGDR